MYDLIVVGGGFWGVSMALFAEAQGKKVCLIGASRDGEASRNAAGLFALGWFKETRASREMAYQALMDAQRLGVTIRNTGVRSINYKGEPGSSADFYTFAPYQFLSLREPDIRHAVEAVVSPNCIVVANGLGDCVEAKKIVLCVGSFTDQLLTASGYPPLGVKSLWGSALIVKGQGFEKPLQVFSNPFAHFTIREWGNGMLRVGETLEAKPEQRTAYLQKMLDKVGMHIGLDNPANTMTLSGARPILPQGMMFTHIPNGPYVATGGGRSGAIMSFAYARLGYQQMFGA